MKKTIYILALIALVSYADICRTSPFITVFGGDISGVEGLQLGWDYDDGLLAVAGKATVEGSDAIFAFLLDYNNNCQVLS